MDFNNLESYLINYDFSVDFGKIKNVEEYAEDSLEESVDFYDIEGNKINVENILYSKDKEAVNETQGTISGLPVPKYGENEIEISNDLSNFKVGNYYLIKYYDPFSNYTWYFISQLTTSGFKDFELYVISSNELYRDNTIEDDLDLDL